MCWGPNSAETPFVLARKAVFYDGAANNETNDETEWHKLYQWPKNGEAGT